MASSVLTLLIAFASLSNLLVEGKVVFTDTFSSAFTVNTTSSNYVYYARKPIVANDGKIFVNTKKTLTQDVRPYKLTVPYGPTGLSDRFKSIVVHKSYWNVTKKQVLTCELKTWSQQSNTAKHPFGKAVTDPSDDIRLGTCGLYFGDPQSLILAHFLQSDKQNFPYHARQSFGQNKTGPLGNYYSFHALRVGVSKRTSPTTYSTLAVQYDRGAGTLSWLADGKVVHTVSSIGLPPPSNMITVLSTGGTTTKAVDPAGFQCGFGCWDFLDFADPLNSKNTKGLAKLANVSYTFPTSWVVQPSTTASRLFGQGMLSDRASLKIDITTKARLLREGKIENN